MILNAAFEGSREVTELRTTTCSRDELMTSKDLPNGRHQIRDLVRETGAKYPWESGIATDLGPLVRYWIDCSEIRWPLGDFFDFERPSDPRSGRG